MRKLEEVTNQMNSGWYDKLLIELNVMDRMRVNIV